METSMREMKRVGIFGWGVVAPKSPDIASFERNLAGARSWLSPFREFGPSNFLVGYPDFDFDAYQPWMNERFPSSRFSQLKDKMGPVVQYSIGAFIQSLDQNPGIEQYLQSLGTACHIYVGTGLGDLTIQHEESLRLDRAQKRWNEFWASPDRCSALRNHLAGDVDPDSPPPASDEAIGSEAWIDAKHRYEAYWAPRSDALAAYLFEAARIQSEPIPPSSGAAKLGNIRQKISRIRALNKEWGCPEEPWASVSPNLLWNIANIGAAQISMIGRIHGSAYAPVAACASFGIAIKMALDAIRSGDAKAVVIGMSDPPPHPLSISAFYNANVLSADASVSAPLTGLKGTHVSGGSCVWILGDAEALVAEGFQPVGMEIITVGASSDAHHIITPSRDGPQLAMRQALENLDPSQISNWDMHATATPGDASEIEHSLEILPHDVLFTARKGTFGHGMSVGGGWELTAQHLGMSNGSLFPTVLAEGELHADVKLHEAKFVHETRCTIKGGYSGKMSMGIGGINSCVISRPWEAKEEVESSTEVPGRHPVSTT
ncbi:MAG TPA: beta-ketoacyl synthase N-terminal-like domain-containing protein [Thermoanaerobaculia bacterium]|nr:beta-ketoacyl synthase N-terminal-like domain-containing protein [Thermoanaerobaculia bacterium]